MSAALAVIVSSILVIALGGGVTEYGCKLPGISSICRSMGLEERESTAEEVIAELYGIRPSDPDDLQITVENYNTVQLKISPGANWLDETHFVVIGQEEPIPLSQFFSQGLGSLDSIKIVQKSFGGSMNQVRDITDEVKSRLVDFEIDYLKNSLEHGLHWQCGLGGCRIDSVRSYSNLCRPSLSEVRVTQGNKNAWTKIDRNICFVDPPPKKLGEFEVHVPNLDVSLCLDFQDFPFEIQAGVPYSAKFIFIDGRERIYSIPFNKDNNPRIDRAEENWIELEPIKELNPIGNPPKTLVAYVPSYSSGPFHFEIASGLSSCLERSTDARWLIDLDQKGLSEINEIDGKYQLWPYQTISSEVSKNMMKGPIPIAIALEESGERIGPYWFILDAAAAVGISSSNEKKDQGSRGPEAECGPMYAQNIICEAKNPATWIGVREVAFGKSPDNLNSVIQLSYTTEDLVRRCEYPDETCIPFKFRVPSDWRDIYYATTDDEGAVSSVERIQIVGRN